MNDALLLATSAGLVIFQHDGESWGEARRCLTDQTVTSVIARQGVILAGTRDGVYRSDDLGNTWREANTGLTVRLIRWLTYHPDIPGLSFAGTEPASIFISRDGAETWRSCPEVDTLRREHG